MSVFQNLQSVTIEVDIAIKVHLEERPDGNLGPAMVLGTVGSFVEGKVVFDGKTRKSGLVRLARSECRGGGPESD
jgi:hypothetical protein